MSEQQPTYEFYRYFLVGGKLNGGDFGITLKTKQHVSPKDVKAHFEGHGFNITTLAITSVYEFPDEADYNDYQQI